PAVLTPARAMRQSEQSICCGCGDELMTMFFRSSLRKARAYIQIIGTTATACVILAVVPAHAQFFGQPVEMPWTGTEHLRRPCQERALLQGHKGVVRSLAFWPDGRTLATAGA